MPDEVDHNKLIAATAKTVLKPLGLKRDGKSRVWFDDHGWWSVVVEFQPSAWSRGTYLNVGICWLFYEQAHWSFDIGYREQNGEFVDAKKEQKFTVGVHGLAECARERVLDYRQKFATLDGAFQHYQSTPLRGHWDFYYAAIIAALHGDLTIARKHFDDLLKLTAEYQWQKGLRYRAVDLISLLDNRVRLLESLTGIIFRTRAAMGLPEINEQQLRLLA